MRRARNVVALTRQPSMAVDLVRVSASDRLEFAFGAFRLATFRLASHLLHGESPSDVNRLLRVAARLFRPGARLLLRVEPPQLGEHAAEGLGILLHLRRLKLLDALQQRAPLAVRLVALQELAHVAARLVVLLRLDKRLRAAVQSLLVPGVQVERLPRRLGGVLPVLELQRDGGAVQVQAELDLLRLLLLIVREALVVLHEAERLVVLALRELELASLVRVVPRGFRRLAHLHALAVGHGPHVLLLLEGGQGHGERHRVRAARGFGERPGAIRGNARLRRLALLHEHHALLQARRRRLVARLEGERLGGPAVRRDGHHARRAVVGAVPALALRHRLLGAPPVADGLHHAELLEGHHDIRRLRRRGAGAGGHAVEVLRPAGHVLHLVPHGLALLHLPQH
mmetsp:Transcript_7481/g.31133  ORF Transcript_7481/g.31133 Transcript_7481/m.31133 type:complete len:398 (-) Transcript_7481:769-1962(-)